MDGVIMMRPFQLSWAAVTQRERFMMLVYDMARQEASYSTDEPHRSVNVAQTDSKFLLYS